MTQTLQHSQEPKGQELTGLDQAVGRRLRVLRRTKGLSLEVLADKAKMSIGFLSQVERGLSSPSLRVLATLADALDTGIASLIDDEIPRANDDRIVTRQTERPQLKLWRWGVSKQLLSAGNPDAKLNLFMVTLEPGGSTGEEDYSHDGEEAGLVLDGTLQLIVEERTWTLNAGDSFRFASRLPHRFSNPQGDAQTRVLWVNALTA
jgi:transcriptional regulator with XRE-family HTH domain